MKTGTTAFSDWLRMRLREQNLTQSALAKSLNVDASTISKWCRNPASMGEGGRRNLARFLGVEVPKALTQSDTVSDNANRISRTLNEPVILNVVNDGIPDHCIIQLADELGLFRESGIELLERDDSSVYGLPSAYPERQRALAEITRQSLRDNDFVLVSGQQYALNVETLDNVSSIEVAETNSYTGWSLICSAMKRLDGPYSLLTGKLQRFRELFERIHEAGLLGHEDRISRIGCLGPSETRFMWLALGLHRELMGEDAYCTPNSKDLSLTFGKSWAERNVRTELLSTLDDVGVSEKDIVVGDCLTLAIALAKPERYKVLLTYGDIVNVIAELSPSSHLKTVDRLKRQYGKNSNGQERKDEEVVRAFQKAWKEHLTELLKPVSWFLLHKPGLDDQLVADVASKVSVVAEKVVQQVRKGRQPSMEELFRIVKRYRFDEATPHPVHPETYVEPYDGLQYSPFVKACDLSYRFEYRQKDS